MSGGAGPFVAVVGAGLAGLAAALGANQAGARVVVVDGGLGASGMSSGALDDIPWETRDRAARVLGLEPRAAEHPALEELARALGGVHLPEPGEPLCVLATSAGRLRSARGCDAALLDLARLAPGTRVLLPRAERAGWDADHLAASLTEAAAAERALRFHAVDAEVLRYARERLGSDLDLAAAHDDPARRGWLAGRLGAQVTREAEGPLAFLLGPWLGLEAGVAEAIRAELGVPVGEILCGVPGTAGRRIERRLRAAFDALGVERIEGRLARLAPRSAGGYELCMDEGAPVVADAVVLAVGGLTGGGVVYAPPEHASGPTGASRVRPAFRPSFEGNICVVFGEEAGPSSSTFGPSLDAVAWPRGLEAGVLESVGARSDPEVGVFVAGDFALGRPRTVGEAARSGFEAGRLAAVRAGG